MREWGIIKAQRTYTKYQMWFSLGNKGKIESFLFTHGLSISGVLHSLLNI